MMRELWKNDGGKNLPFGPMMRSWLLNESPMSPSIGRGTETGCGKRWRWLFPKHFRLRHSGRKIALVPAGGGFHGRAGARPGDREKSGQPGKMEPAALSFSSSKGCRELPGFPAGNRSGWPKRRWAGWPRGFPGNPPSGTVMCSRWTARERPPWAGPRRFCETSWRAFGNLPSMGRLPPGMNGRGGHPGGGAAWIQQAKAPLVKAPLVKAPLAKAPLAKAPQVKTRQVKTWQVETP